MKILTEMVIEFCLIRAFIMVVLYFWEWFFTPITGIPPITPLEMLGVLFCFISCAFLTAGESETRADLYIDKGSRLGLILLVGYILHCLITW